MRASLFMMSVIGMNDNLVIPHTGRATRADAVRNRDLILCTARRLFDQSGIEAVSMSDIAQAAEVGKGTLYRHYPNKSAVIYALLDEEQCAMQEAVLRRLRESNDAYHNLEWVLEVILNFVVQNQSVLTSLSEQTALSHPAHIWWLATLRGLLSRLSVPLDVDYVASLVYIMLDPRTIGFQLQNGFTQERILSNLQGVLELLTQ